MIAQVNASVLGVLGSIVNSATKELERSVLGMHGQCLCGALTAARWRLDFGRDSVPELFLGAQRVLTSPRTHLEGSGVIFKLG